MKFNTSATCSLSILLLATITWVSGVHGLPAPQSSVTNSVASPNTTLPSARDVWDPDIIVPNANTVWNIGQEVTVTWDTSDMPQHVTNPKGRLVLGYLEADSTSEHLDFDNPLADGFDLSQGKVQVQVPQVPPGSNYMIVLYGDSGNRSPTFPIQ